MKKKCREGEFGHLAQASWLLASKRELECGLDHHVAAGSRADFHFLYLSNLEVFHLSHLGCLLGHTCHSFKCSTSQEPCSAQDQRKLYKGWSKLSDFTIYRELRRELGSSDHPTSVSWTPFLVNIKKIFFLLASFHRRFSISRTSINLETSQ